MLGKEGLHQSTLKLEIVLSINFGGLRYFREMIILVYGVGLEMAMGRQ